MRNLRVVPDRLLSIVPAGAAHAEVAVDAAAEAAALALVLAAAVSAGARLGALAAALGALAAALAAVGAVELVEPEQAEKTSALIAVNRQMLLA